MAEQTRSGVLSWDEEAQQLKVSVTEEGGRRRPVRQGHDLGPDLKEIPGAELDGMEVDFTWTGGKIRDMRPRGSTAPARVRTKRARSDRFINPYTFLPATPRAAAEGDLADGAPAGHDRLHEDRWTGLLRVRLTTVTPLLLLDPSRARQTDQHGAAHAVHPVLYRNGRVHLPATSVKGMLRAAYEAVTNSRLGVFAGHDGRLAHRMKPSVSRSMVPARISDDLETVMLLPGDTPPGGQAKQGGAPLLHAAWLPRYKGRPVRYEDGSLPRHGDEVVALVERVEHRRRRPGFDFWQVRSIAPKDGPLPARPGPAPRSGASAHRPTGRTKQIRGWVCVTNQNIGNKHDERVFFSDAAGPVEHPLSPALREQWRDTVRDYWAAHQDKDVPERDRFAQQGGTPGGTRTGEEGTTWSPHQYDPDYRTLRPGSLCYAHVSADGRTVLGLYPVMIARSLFALPPADLLHPSLQPARSLPELSPADRVFGWVSPSGSGAHRGRLRIGPVTPQDVVPQTFEDPGLPLAVLGQPKPQQGRFYLGRGPQGTAPLSSSTPKDRWYGPGQALRGRKAYWHHSGLAPDHWEEPTEDRSRTADRAGRFREYRRPDGAHGPQRDTQNRSVLGWIPPGSTFTFDVTVTDLTAVELGALVWLLDLPEGHHHRLGYGKPLGFGSVRLQLDPDACALRTGQQWADSYRSLDPAADQPPAGQAGILEDARRCFAEAAAEGPHAEGRHLEAFLKVASGLDDAAVHYPRVRPRDLPAGEHVPPHPEGKSFSWFVANDQEENGRTMSGRGQSLPAWDNPHLPFHDER
ncbi:TIGR03986 family CRISPR-associated RAMP protein [Streptomyces sp. NPDC001380]|uniref:TIGR03986 family type III CRISPR-associated RAMP protein n=1 Tax=Streptomyces sp. NPDC001380 TaxID=3364566 RepID=UPI0036CE2B0E